MRWTLLSPPADQPCRPARGVASVSPLAYGERLARQEGIDMDLFTLTCDKLPDTAQVLRFSGSEGLSRLYSFVIELAIPGDDGLVFSMGDALNAPASFTIHGVDGEARSTFHGIIATVDWVEQLAERSVYQVVLMPRLWRLGLSQHGNVFVGKSVKTIVQDVLEDNGFVLDTDFEFRMSSTRYEEMAHVAQYRESDLSFLMRRLERDGIYFFFEQGDDREKLVIIDTKGKQQSSGSVRYLEQANDDTVRMEAFTSLLCRHQTRPGLVRLREYDYLRPTMDLQKQEQVSSHTTMEVVSHDEHYNTPAEGQRLALVRAQELKAREVIFDGRGHTFEVRPGFVFEVTSHPRPSFNARYLALSVEHSGDDAGGPSGGQPAYAVRVEAIPEAVQFRPSRATPIPRIYGTEMGIVDGEQSSPYAQIDSHGRYKVQIYFDENDPRNGKASTWVRMLQPHGGPNEGFHFPLRKDTEVLLVFLGGDPDRPVIAGVVPNAHTPSPVTVDNATHNVILTGGGSRIEIEDNEGAQYIKMTTPPESTLLHLGALDGSGYNVHLSSMGKALVELGGDLDIRVDGMKSEEVTHDVTEHYKEKQSTKVDSDHSVEVKGKEDLKIKGDQTLEAKSNREVKVKSNQKHQVGGTDEVKVTGHQTLGVDGGQTVDVKAGQTITIAGGRTETTTGPVTETTTGAVTSTITGAVTSTITGALTQTITGGATITSPAGYKVVAPSSWFKVTGASGELVGAKVGIVAGIKTDHATLAITGGGMKLDTLGLKIDLCKVAIKNNPMTLHEANAKLANAAIGLYMYGITLFS
jgi:type VI secretion system secreted protein VgrG